MGDSQVDWGISACDASTVTLVTALLKYSEYFEVDVAEHSTRACIDTRMGQNPLNGPKFQGC